MFEVVKKSKIGVLFCFLLFFESKLTNGSGPFGRPLPGTTLLPLIFLSDLLFLYRSGSEGIKVSLLIKSLILATYLYSRLTVDVTLYVSGAVGNGVYFDCDFIVIEKNKKIKNKGINRVFFMK